MSGNSQQPELVINDLSKGMIISKTVSLFIGLVLNMMMVVAFFKSRVLFNSNNLITTNILVASILYAFALLFFVISVLVTETDKLSLLICEPVGMIAMTCACLMVFTLLFGALYQYAIIVHKMPTFHIHRMYTIIGVLWLISISIFILPKPFLREDQFDSFPIANYGGACLPDFTSRKPLALSLSIGMFVFVFTTPLIIAYAYYSIWKQLKDINSYLRNLIVDSASAVTSFPAQTSREQSQQHSEQEKVQNTEIMVLRRAILVSSIFGVFWCPINFIWLYECITMRHVPYYVTGIVHIMMDLYTVVNPLALIYYDLGYRDALYNLLTMFGNFFLWLSTSIVSPLRFRASMSESHLVSSSSLSNFVEEPPSTSNKSCSN